MARRRNPGGRPRRRGPRQSGAEQRGPAAVAVEEAPSGPVELPATLTVGELADILKKSHVDTIKALMRGGVMATVNETTEFDIAFPNSMTYSFKPGIYTIDEIIGNSVWSDHSHP